jgi:hypothetical protein
MTLKEAVESGKKFKLPEYRISVPGFNKTSAWINFDLSVLDAIRTDWIIEAEPEVYEFDNVGWYQAQMVPVTYICAKSDDPNFNSTMLKIIGKRTKLKIEVLE